MRSARCVPRSRSDSRFGDFVSAGAAQIIADNACAHLFVLGAPTTANWRAIDLVEERPVIAARRIIARRTQNVLGDPTSRWHWLANELRGLGLARGEGGRGGDDRHLSRTAADFVG
jgi:2-keto-4-pentenoate hydratase